MNKETKDLSKQQLMTEEYQSKIIPGIGDSGIGLRKGPKGDKWEVNIQCNNRYTGYDGRYESKERARVVNSKIRSELAELGLVSRTKSENAQTNALEI